MRFSIGLLARMLTPADRWLSLSSPKADGIESRLVRAGVSMKIVRESTERAGNVVFVLSPSKRLKHCKNRYSPPTSDRDAPSPAWMYQPTKTAIW